MPGLENCIPRDPVSYLRPGRWGSLGDYWDVVNVP